MTATSATPIRTTRRRSARALAVLAVALGLAAVPVTVLAAPAPAAGHATLAGGVSPLCERCTL